VDVHPNDVEAHFDLGRTYLRSGRHEEGIVELSMALLLDPWDARVAGLLAQAHQRVGDHVRAADAARRALDLEPADSEARYVLATSLVRLGQVEEGQRELAIYQRQQADTSAARTRALDIESLKRRAAILTIEGRHAEAAAVRREVTALEPQNGEAQLALGEALVAAADFAGAIDPLETAARLGAHPDTHRLLANAYGALGRMAQAEQAQQRYAALKREALRQRGARR
jgi:Flp pilus assembly protein TadD